MNLHEQGLNLVGPKDLIVAKSIFIIDDVFLRFHGWQMDPAITRRHRVNWEFWGTRKINDIQWVVVEAFLMLPWEEGKNGLKAVRRFFQF